VFVLKRKREKNFLQIEMTGFDEPFSPVLSGRHEVRAKNE
jgi:hypothetical protein